MKFVRMLAVCAITAATMTAADRWEVGGGVGGGFYTSQDLTSPTGSASAKIQTNIAASAWLDNHAGGIWGGELRYDYQRGDLKLSNGSTQATFAAQSHAFHYDLQAHLGSAEAAVRPFVAAGAGVKIYKGTGSEQAFQPLSDVALLTKAQDLVPVISAGAGVNVKLGERAQLRVEIHDFLTPFPKQVIAPAAGAKAGGWMHDFVPMVGISF